MEKALFLVLRSVAVVTVVWATLGLGVAKLGATSSGHRVALPDGTVAYLANDQHIYVEALPQRGEGLWSFARRLCGTQEAAGTIREANGGRSRLLAGVRLRVPFTLLVPQRQLAAIKALFPNDRGVSTGWQHEVGQVKSSTDESLWKIAEWFTGRGDHYKAIREANGLVDDHLSAGQTVVVPAPLLRSAFRPALPHDSPYYLAYGEDDRGEYAIYRLKKNEALYSSVVVRFTGRVFADDVNSLAVEIAERSGIADVTDIEIGHRVKIPFDVLHPEFLPPGHRMRQEYETALLESAQFSNTVRAKHLEGVTVVLDAGHGGRDVGASMRGVWESVYVYDIAVRVQKLLQETTSAKVYMTTMDGATHSVADADRLPYSKKHRVLTTPNYPIEDSRVGVNLRWYLANSILRQTLANGSDPERTVFLSIHADSLHPSLRGAMAYIAGSRFRRASYAKSGAVYASRREVKENPRVRFTSQEMRKSEGLSRQFAQGLIDAFVARDLQIHDDRPLRDRIVRRRSTWVPAVLRYNKVPAAALLEVCNLMNEEDRRLLQTRAFRNQVAHAIVAGILDYYGVEKPAGGQLVAQRTP